jgi:ferredoxin
MTCLDLCPSGALEKLPLARKKLVKMGDATLVRDRCIVFVSKTKCGACAEHCPTGAVRMVDAPTGIPEPLFTTSICIGCGACHHACPTKPLRAITVSGLAVHTTAVKPTAALLGVKSAPGGEGRGARNGKESDMAGGDGVFPF